MMIQLLLPLFLVFANAQEAGLPANYLEDCKSRDSEFENVERIIQYRERNHGRGVDKKCTEAIAQAKRKCTENMKGDPEGPDLPAAEARDSGLAHAAQMQAESLRAAAQSHRYHRGSCAEENEMVARQCADVEQRSNEDRERNPENQATQTKASEDIEFTQWARKATAAAAERSERCDRAMEELYKRAEERSLIARDAASATPPAPAEPPPESPERNLAEKVADKQAALAKQARALAEGEKPVEATLTALNTVAKQAAPKLARSPALTALQMTLSPSDTSRCDGNRYYANPVAAYNDGCYYKIRPTVTPQSIRRAIQILKAD